MVRLAYLWLLQHAARLYIYVRCVTNFAEVYVPDSDLIRKMWFFSFGQIYVRFQVFDGPPCSPKF